MGPSSGNRSLDGRVDEKVGCQGNTILGPSSVWLPFQTTLSGFCCALTLAPILED